MKKQSFASAGVLAFHGDFAEHLDILRAMNVPCREVRGIEDLSNISHLIIPGGESTVMAKFLEMTGLGKEITKRVREKSLAVYGTCAGAILLAKNVLKSQGVKGLGLMDIEVERNAYGRQVDSFEAELDVKGIGKVRGVFIRAPVIQKAGKGVEVLAELDGRPVLVRQGNLLAGTFHPEIEGELGVHGLFLDLVDGK